jgi:hypothetical protein
MTETKREVYQINMTPELDRRLRAFAEERRWPVGETIRYFIEDGLDGEARRAELRIQAGRRAGHAAPAQMRAIVDAVQAMADEKTRRH